MTRSFAAAERRILGRWGHVAMTALFIALAAAGLWIAVLGGKIGDDMTVVAFAVLVVVGVQAGVMRDYRSPPEDERERAVRARAESWASAAALTPVLAYLAVQSFADQPWLWVPHDDEGFRAAALFLGSVSLGAMIIARGLMTPAYAAMLEDELDTV